MDTTDATLGKMFTISCKAKMTYFNPIDNRFLLEVNILSKKTEAESTTITSTTASTATTTTTITTATEIDCSDTISSPVYNQSRYPAIVPAGSDTSTQRLSCLEPALSIQVFSKCFGPDKEAGQKGWTRDSFWNYLSTSYEEGLRLEATVIFKGQSFGRQFLCKFESKFENVSGPIGKVVVRSRTRQSFGHFEDVLDFALIKDESVRSVESQQIADGSQGHFGIPENSHRPCRSLICLQTLSRLVLNGNGIEKLPEDFGNLIRLVYLDISNNKLRTLPISMGRMIILQYINTSGNPLEAPLSCFPPVEICNAEGHNSPPSIIRFLATMGENGSSEEMEYAIENVPYEENRKEEQSKPRQGGIRDWFDIVEWFLLLLAVFAVLGTVKVYLEEKRVQKEMEERAQMSWFHTLLEWLKEILQEWVRIKT